MRSSFQKIALLAVVMYGLVGSVAHAAPITWFTPANPANGSSSIPTGTAYTSNLGVAFKTGPNSTYSLDWVNLELTSGAANATRTVKLALHDATDDIAYSAVAGTTAHAVNTLSFTTPATANTPFNLYLDASLIPNVSSYVMSGNTAYTLLLYNPSDAVALRRQQGYAQNTTNNFYTVGGGFVALDTFRNNTANYANVTGVSYPTFAISFGGTEPASVPEPPPLALAVSAIAGWWLAARRRGRAKSA